MVNSSEQPSRYSREARDNRRRTHRRPLQGVNRTEQDHLDSTVRVGERFQQMTTLRGMVEEAKGQLPKNVSTQRIVITIATKGPDGEDIGTQKMTYDDVVRNHELARSAAWARLGEHG